jgi:hypothetical protein
VKKTNLFLLLMLITILGAGTASFAACTTATFPAGNGVWGIELGGGSGGTTPYDNVLMQLTFASGGTFSGTSWEAVGYGGVSGSTSISGKWSALSTSGCEYTMTITSSGRTFNFTLNNGGKGGTIADATSTGYTTVGLMAEEGTVTCSASTVKKKQYSLFSQGYISGVGLVTGTGEILFGSTGTTVSTDTVVTLDLGASGNLVLPGSGTDTIGSNCQGSASLVTAAGTFDVDTVVVDSGKEIFFIVTNTGEQVSGFFLE